MSLTWKLRRKIAASLTALAIVTTACHHNAPTPSLDPTSRRIVLIEHGKPVEAGTRFAYQFNDEPPLIWTADGHGGPPVLYHGRELSPDEIKSIRLLKGKEARERFGDSTLNAAFLIELKPLSERSAIPTALDLEVYRTVLDSMFTPRAKSMFSRIAVVESTEVFKRENSAALVKSLVDVRGVDSVMAGDLAERSYEAHPLSQLSIQDLRMPVLMLGRAALAPLPREDPDKYWSMFYEHFPGTSGLISLSSIGYNSDGTRAVLMVDVGCGSLCGQGYIVVVQRDAAGWRLITIQTTWVS
jgi:hypothetical protein